MSEPKFAYQTYRLSKTYPPGKTVIRDISLSFYYGAKIGVLGLNGAGKSTLLRIMAGEEKDFDGEAYPGKGIRVGYLSQEPRLDPEKNVRQNIMDGLGGVVAIVNRFNEINERLGDPDLDPDAMEKLLSEQAQVQEEIDQHNGWEIDRTLEIAMDALRVPPGESRVEALSGGERRRVALCRLLLDRPDLLLLDEPTNHLDAESVAWLERFLSDYEGTVVAVTHDRYFLDNIAGWILELDRGHGIPWKGNYSSWLEQKEQRLAEEQKQDDRRRRTLEHELEWIRMSPRGRQAKGKARISAFEDLASAATPEKIQEMEIYIPVSQRLGERVIDVEGLTKAYGDQLLFEDLSFSIPPGSIVGVIGGNGAGKTTLFRILTGQEEPDRGSVTLGETAQLSYVDQVRDSLDDRAPVWKEIAGGEQETLRLGKVEMSARAYCARFNFTGSDQQKSVGVLSGGERNRVHLAKMLRSGGNVLLLDEPTNDLDVNTLRALEEAILAFAGCVLVISHDRWFLDRICTHILAFEGDSRVELCEGNYQQYEEEKRRRLGADAARPKRLKYKKLAR